MNRRQRVRGSVSKKWVFFFGTFFILLNCVLAGTSLEKAEQLIEQRRFQEAETLLRQITAQNPSDERAHLVLGDLYLRFQAYPQAFSEYRSVLILDRTNVQALINLGLIARQQGDPKTAFKLFSDAAALQPNSIKAHRNLAYLYGVLGNPAGAVAEYELLSKLDPKGDAQLQLAKLYQRQRDTASAVRLTRKYLRTHGEDAEGWNALAQMRLDQHENEESLEASGEALKRNPKSVPFLLTHAKAALELRSWKHASMAANDARQILKMDPSNSEANRILLRADEILSKKKLQFFGTLFILVLLASLAVLWNMWRKREDRESEKDQLIEKLGHQLEELNTLEEIIEYIFSHCRDLFDLPKGMFFVMNPSETQMSCMFTNYKVVLSDSLEVKADKMPEWHDLFRGRPMTTTQAFRTPSFADTFPDAKRIFEKHDVRLLIPFFAKNKLLALVALGGISRREFRNRIAAIREKVEIGYLFAEKAAMAIENSTLYELSMVDEQTRVFNKRFFTQLLSDEIRRFERYQQPVSLLMIDIDHFKNLNDTYGHPQGDAILREIAQNLKEYVRQGMDAVFRYGGEEFTIVLPATPADKAGETAERIRGGIAHYLFSGLPPDMRVTVSIGVATFPEHANADWELIQAADQALYQSKKDGRNRVTIAEKGARKSFPSTGT